MPKPTKKQKKPRYGSLKHFNSNILDWHEITHYFRDSKLVTMTKKDPHTGEEFIPKRSNQVFVKPQNRKDYHNHRAKLMRHTCSYLDKPLKKNIQIILELMQKSKEQIFHKHFLLGKGFSFEASNNVHEVEGKIHHCVYNYAIIPMGKDQIKILKYD